MREEPPPGVGMPAPRSSLLPVARGLPGLADGGFSKPRGAAAPAPRREGALQTRPGGRVSGSCPEQTRSWRAHGPGAVGPAASLPTCPRAELPRSKASPSPGGATLTTDAAGKGRGPVVTPHGVRAPACVLHPQPAALRSPPPPPARCLRPPRTALGRAPLPANAPDARDPCGHAPARGPRVGAAGRFRGFRAPDGDRQPGGCREQGGPPASCLDGEAGPFTWKLPAPPVCRPTSSEAPEGHDRPLLPHTGQELTKRAFIRSKKNLRGVKYQIDTKTLHPVSEEWDSGRPCGGGPWPSTPWWLQLWGSTGRHSAVRPVGRRASPGHAAGPSPTPRTAAPAVLC